MLSRRIVYLVIALVIGLLAARYFPKSQSAAAHSLLGAFTGCADLLGVERPTTGDVSVLSLASASDMAHFWRQKDCTAIVKNCDKSVAANDFPSFVVSDGSWSLLAAISDDQLQVYVVSDSPKWVDWETIRDDLAGKPTVSLTGPKKRRIEPTLTLFEQSINLGSSFGAGVIEREATLFNPSDEAIRIENQKFSCDCTRAQFSGQIIPPHGYIRAHLKMDTSSNNSGRAEVKWLVETTPPSASKLIPVIALVEPGAALSPQQIALNEMTAESSVSYFDALLTTSSLDAEVDLYPVHLDPGMRLESIEKGSSRHVISFSVNALESHRDGAGYFRTKAILAVENLTEGRRLFTVESAGRLAPAIRVFPSAANMGKVNAGDVISRSVTIKTDCKGARLATAVHPEYVQADLKKRHHEIEDLCARDGRFFSNFCPIESRKGVSEHTGDGSSW